MITEKVGTATRETTVNDVALEVQAAATEKFGIATGTGAKDRRSVILEAAQERASDDVAHAARAATVPDVITEAPATVSTRRIMAENDFIDEINGDLVDTTQSVVVSTAKTAPELGIAESLQTSKARLLAAPKQLATDLIDISPTSFPCILSHRR